ncbi:branched-chain amino acid ABC transporter ATP-binding protein/permease [Rhizobacter sp. AJA081-3]|uniref:branched-chain amino acid ABC transporter ATP-binding protein/permease n=1 Tax=Rhizobacter sp. AJA081-3 TaxID=2753607 RepID=UPI001ADF5E77|nr:branched-chain amino acid ABC transporter ATP-binding protein/permease [Rhizobacter sp. AJA081-3]QTN23736.1 branched-chain amino acid ABC transporter ATP-binding protein/permease [Rhizobacter sp. AJA081-3]
MTDDAQARAIPARARSPRLALAPEAWIVLALAAMPFVLLQTGGSVDTAIRILIWGLFGLGFDILFGYAGLLSFGQAAFFGAGGFVTAYLLISGAVSSVLLATLIGITVAMALSVLVGWVSLRRVGIYFSMITFAIGELAHFMQNSVLSRWTGGDNGLPGVPYPRFKVGERLVEIAPGWGMYVMLAVIFVATFWFARRLVQSPFGHVLNAMRINPDRTLAVGHHLQRYKMAALVVSAAYSGLAGAMLGVFQSYIGPDAVSLETSSQVVMQTVIGGVRTLVGPLVGAAIWIFLRDVLQQIPGIGGAWKLILGALFVLAVTVMRRGIVGEIRHWHQQRTARAIAGAAAARPRDLGPAAEKVQPIRASAVATRVAPGADAPVAIEARDIRMQFGGLVALEQVNLAVRSGEIMGLIGPNGAGKSTLFKIMTGELRPTAGDVVFGERVITGIGVREACRIGVSKSYQIVQVYPELTARENLYVPILARQRGAFRFDVLRTLRGNPAMEEEVERALRVMELHERCDVMVSEMAYGEKRRLEIAIALATEPRVLLLDEPLAGLSPAERVQVVQVIRHAAEGRTVLIVEHDMDAVFELADRITMLHMGRNLITGTPAEIRDNAAVHTAYLGARDERPAA